MSEWYSDLEHDAFASKHVRAVFDDGTVLEGRLVYDQSDESVRLGSRQLSIPWDDGSTSIVPCPEVLWCGEDEQWHPLKGIESLDLVWDERDWERIDAKDVRHGDAVVVNGRLCTVDKAWPDDYRPQVVTDAPGRMLIDLSLVSFALRRKAKVKVPMDPGYYRDRDGGFWKMWLYSEGHAVWQPMLVDIGDTCHMNSALEMKRLMPLTPVHFESGRAA